MMCNMGSPKQTAYMVYAVKPVIHEIFKDKQYDPIYPGVLDGCYQAMVITERKNEPDINDAECQVNTPVEEHKIDILCCIFK